MESLILQNAQAEAAVRPDIGRLISFRRTDGENVLWVADDPFAYKAAMPLYGGLKVMVSPEVLWQQIRQEHRSDSTDGGSWTVLEKSNLYVKMQTFSNDLGVKVTWSIQMHESLPELMLNYQIERVEESPFPVHLWTIAQVPLEGELYLSKQPHIPMSYRNCIWAPKLDGHVEQFPGNKMIRFSGAGQSEPLKIGTFGRWIAHVNKKSVFVIHVPEAERKPYVEGSNLQGFSYAGRFPFYEMEHTGPLSMLRIGESFQALENWTFMDLSGGNDPVHALAKQLNKGQN